jgi:hypothetical protein
VYQPWTSSVRQPPPPLDRPVWVSLDSLYGSPDAPDAESVDPPPGGLLVATGRVPGILKHWARAVDGRWFGRVNFAVCDSYGAVVAEHHPALVPAAALSPRDGDPPR